MVLEVTPRTRRPMCRCSENVILKKVMNLLPKIGDPSLRSG